jgi:hypothetical protein
MQIESEKRDSAPQNLATPKVHTLRGDNMGQCVHDAVFPQYRRAIRYAGSGGLDNRSQP